MKESFFNYSESRKAPYLRFPQVGRLLMFSTKSLILSCPEEAKNNLNANCSATSHTPEWKTVEGLVGRVRLKKTWEVLSLIWKQWFQAQSCLQLMWDFRDAWTKWTLFYPLNTACTINFLLPHLWYYLCSQFSLRSLHSQESGFTSVLPECCPTYLY